MGLNSETNSCTTSHFFVVLYPNRASETFHNILRDNESETDILYLKNIAI